MSMTGVEKAAILLMSLGEDNASSVLKLMEPREVQKLGTAMAGMKAVRQEQVYDVIQNFVEELESQAPINTGPGYLRKVMVKAVGHSKAERLMVSAQSGRESSGLAALKWMDPRSVAELIRSEHPQIIALVLAQLDPDQAGSVLSFLPDEMRSSIVIRIANLSEVPQGALAELDQLIERQFSDESSTRANVGGRRVAADLMNNLPPEIEAALMEQIRKEDEELGKDIQDLMFVFDNLAEVDDRSLQTLLRDVSTNDLVLALKGADPDLKERVFRNMSKRAAEILADDLEVLGPVRLVQVEEAQKKIVTQALELAEKGAIRLGMGGEKYV